MTVLVADDNEKSRELLEVFLGHLGCTVVLASNGRAAIELAGAVHPDLFIFDIHMPELDGYQAMAQLRRDPLFCRTPILALTASAGEDDRVRALAAGFDAFLTKPISLASIRDAIAAALPDQSVPALG